MYKERIDTCGNRIKKALEIRQMRQSDLCKLADVPKSSLSLYLSGAYEPKQDRIYSMALALNVSEAWLMGYDVPIDRKLGESPKQIALSEHEQFMVELFRRIPEDKQDMVLNVIQTVLDAYK